MFKNHEAEAQLTEERLALSAIEQKVKALIDDKISARPETTLALRSVQLATMWLGKAKGALGIKTPYGASFDASSKRIEDRSDVAEVTDPLPSDEVVAVKSLRASLNAMESKILNDMTIMPQNRNYQNSVQNAWTNCCNATMWLGMVLNAIKVESEKAAVRKQEKTILVGKKVSENKPNESEKSDVITTGDQLPPTPPTGETLPPPPTTGDASIGKIDPPAATASTAKTEAPKESKPKAQRNGGKNGNGEKASK